MKVFSRASEFDRGAHVLPWFYAVCANEVRAIERRRGALATDQDAPDVMSSDAGADELLLRAELGRALQQAVSALDADAAEAISSVLGNGARPKMPEATFRKRVSRAYARLRILLGSYHAI